jgi:hypothetical protein
VHRKRAGGPYCRRDKDRLRRIACNLKPTGEESEEEI